ncbi:MAG TPA: AAA family ATPase [Leptolyngbyaceae cyanobacterium]
MTSTLVTLPGYHFINLLYSGSKTEVYRAYRESDKSSVIIKLLKIEYPTPQDIIQFRNHYLISKNLDYRGIVKPYSLENYRNSLALVMEDFKGISLLEYSQSQPLEIKDFLEIAIAISKILEKIYQYKVIHKDIKPANLLIEPHTKEVKITDFSLASLLPRESQEIQNPNVLEGTLAYISPEQTGRMNRGIDYRTDFYSLGVTFYELVTGQIPFNFSDPIELVHCHIARMPVPPIEINPAIPQMVNDIILKLIAKMPEERYQSAYGIRKDLENCLQQWETKSHISLFTLGQEDSYDRFQIPEKLYGRDREVQTLLAAFERVNQGSSELMLVTGFSGIGKSALVQEIYKPITKQRGYFVAGKFDQFQRNIPYSAIVNALRSLVRQLLTENERTLEKWQDKLLTALSSNGQIIIDVIPELELIIGKQPAVQQLNSIELQNRFNSVFQNFIRVFCAREHPLAIFLDDLQWADAATLKLIEVMMKDRDTHYLFLIGAYRDNEVDPTHPLMITIDMLRDRGAIVNAIALAPLELQHITNLTAETLHDDTKAVEPLAKLVIQKTQGNPFFVNQFLTTLYQENLLTFHPPSSESKALWRWNLSSIETIGITDNVIDLMVRKLKRLPEATQRVIQLAACAGNTFDLKNLSIIYEKSLNETFQDLLPAIQEGLILPTSEIEIGSEPTVDYLFAIRSYKFLHDRVQQSGYALIDETKQKAVRLQIGRLLLANISAEKRSERIFELVDHLNTGRALITDETEKVNLSNLNLFAARKAKDATAYAAARQYLIIGLEILPGDIWQEFYSLAFTLHKELAEVEYLNGNFEKSEALIKLAFDRAKSATEKAEVYNILIVQYTLLTKYEEAIQAGLKALQLLEINLPEGDLSIAVKSELSEAKARLATKEIARLIDEEKMQDTAKKVAVKLLGHMGPLTFFSSQELWKWTVVKAIDLSLQYGFVAEGSYCYSCYGIILSAILGDYQSAYQFGLLALQLSDTSNNLSQNCQDNVIFANYLNCWVKPIDTTNYLNNEGYKVGLQSGNLQWSGYNRMFQTITLFFQGVSLEQILEEISNFLLFCNKTKNQWATDIILANKLAVLKLMGQDDGTREEKHLENFYQHKSKAAICEFHVLKAQIFYLYEQTEEALKWAKSASEIINYLMGHISSSHHNFYYSLILTDLYQSASDAEQQQYREILAVNQRQLKIWTDNCPENFLHKYLLVEAEIARIFGQQLEAIELYDRAIESAREHNFIQNEALGNELAAKFWLAKGKADFARIYLKNAHYGYQRWGAIGKTEHLAKKYAHLLDREPKIRTELISTHLSSSINTTGKSASEELDSLTVMKAAQAISGEIVLDKLLTKLMRILIENAGATKGLLILVQEERHLIVARVSVNANSLAISESEQVILERRAISERELPVTIINYVERTGADVVLSNASKEGAFTADSYIASHQLKSVLCTPIRNQGKAIALLYLENNLIDGAFTPSRLEILKLLCSQAAISLDNARLYEQLEDYSRTLEQRVSDRTQQLQQEIRDRHRAESQLQRINTRYYNLAANIQVMIYQFMLHPDGSVSCPYVSPACRSIFGTEPEAVQKNEIKLSSLIHPDDRLMVDESIAISANTLQPWHCVWRIIVNSKTKWVEANSRPEKQADGSIIWDGLVIDITERKLAEEAVKESESKYRSLVETSQDMIFSVDAEGKYSFVNSAVKQIFGYEPHEMIGRKFGDFKTPEQLNKDLEIFKRLMAGEQIFQYETVQIAKDGRPINLLSNAIVLRDPEGNVIGTTGTASDITERKKSEAALQKAKEAADAANKAKSEFLSKMSHELRTPLNAILGFTQVLARDITLTPKQQEHLGIISRSGEHLLTLINDVLEMSKIEAGKITLNSHSFDLYCLLDTLEEMFKLKAESKGLQLIFKRNFNVPKYVKTDESKLRQVLINLIGNAIKFTKQGSVKLRVKTDEAETNNADKLSLFPLYFEIEDTGTGIKSEEIDSLFDPFVQTETGRKSQEGTGLGLPISRQFVQLMGGEISVISNWERGTIFKFNIQISTGEVNEFPTNLNSRRAIGLEANQKSYRILVVEDKWESRSFLVQLLSSVGFEVREATNGKEAIDIWSGWQPHLIWMDMQMPVMDGYEATKEIKTREKEIQKSENREKPTVIIALTANAFEEQRSLILANGCDDFVSKPFREAIVFEKMAQHLGVQYICERENPASLPKPYRHELTSEALQEMPQSWIAEIHQAAMELDDRLLLQIINQNREINPTIADNLIFMTEKLRFDKILNLTKPHIES